VNVDIAAGRYFTDPPSSGCYWERESGLGGSLGEILANDFVGFNADQLIVDVLGSDKAFKSESDCGTWTNSPPRGSQGSSIPPGTWLVGAQVSPGTYHVTAGSGCYWERLRGFSGDVRDIIANDFESSGGSLLVSVSGVDTGFHSDGDCGTWTRASNLSDTAPSPEGESLAEIEANRDASRQRHGISW
jgi:hypothetical protein